MNATNDIRALHAKAMKTGCATTATIKVNGQKCLVKVSPSKDGQQQVHVSTLRAPLGMRECSQTEFTYDEKHIGEQLGKFSEKIIEAEINAMCEKTISTSKGQKNSLMINDRKCEVVTGLTSSGEACVVISYTPPDSQEWYCVHGFRHKKGESLAEHIAEASKEILRSEGLHLLLGAKANGIESIVAPIVERLHQPIAEKEVDVRMEEIGTILENIRTFARRNPIWADGLSILKTVLDKLVGDEEMIQGSNGNFSINDCSDPACRKVAMQVEGLQLLCDELLVSSLGVNNVIASIAKCLHQPILEEEMDMRMEQIETILGDVKTFIQQKSMPESSIATLKTALGKFVDNKKMIQRSDGNSSINEYGSLACCVIAFQVKELQSLLDIKADGIDGVISSITDCLCILESLHFYLPASGGQIDEQILKGQINGQMELIGKKLEEVMTFVQGVFMRQENSQMGLIGKIVERAKISAKRTLLRKNPLSEASLSALREAMAQLQLASRANMIQLPNGNFSINDCDNPACRKVASQIEELQQLFYGDFSPINFSTFFFSQIGKLLLLFCVKIIAATRQNVEQAQRRMAAEMASECFGASGKIDLGKARELRDRIKSFTVLPKKFSTIPGASLMLSQVSCVLDNLIDHAQETGSLREIIDRASELSPGDHGRQILGTMGSNLKSPVKPGKAILISLFSLHRQKGLPSCTINSIINAELRNHPERVAKILEQILAGPTFNFPSGYLIHQQQIVRKDERGYIPANLATGDNAQRDEIFAQENSCKYLAAGIERDSSNPYGLLFPLGNLADVLFANFFQASEFGNRHLPTKDNLEYGTMFIYQGVKSERDTYSELEISVAGADFEAGMERLKGAAEEQKVRSMHYMRIATTSTKGNHAENIDIDALLKLNLDALKVGKPHIIGDRNWIDGWGHPEFLAIVKTIDPSTNTPTYSFQTVCSEDPGDPMKEANISRFDVYQPL